MCDVKAWTGMIGIRIGTGGGLLRVWQGNFWFHKIWRIS